MTSNQSMLKPNPLERGVRSPALLHLNESHHCPTANSLCRQDRTWQFNITVTFGPISMCAIWTTYNYFILAAELEIKFFYRLSHLSFTFSLRFIEMLLGALFKGSAKNKEKLYQHRERYFCKNEKHETPQTSSRSSHKKDSLLSALERKGRGEMNAKECDVQLSVKYKHADEKQDNILIVKKTPLICCGQGSE